MPNDKRVPNAPRRSLVLAVIAMTLTAPACGRADDATPQRPAILFNRWQEDWSVLADPRVPRQPGDELKYVPLSRDDPKSYLSFGASLRVRFEANDAPNFGVQDTPAQSYFLNRTEVHADLRVADQLQVFTQLQAEYAPGKTDPTPVDRNRLDLEQGFVALVEPVDDGTLKLRLGRQQMAFDLQRFVSIRDGPNVRQSYDAAWGDYENGPWRYIAFYGYPVQVLDTATFDDYSGNALTYGGLRIEKQLSAGVSASAYYSHYTNDNARFTSVSGDERRNILDGRFAVISSGFDGDVEIMGQTGSIANESIRAWAVGTTAGYTFSATEWTPRVGIQFDAASGDKNPHDGVLQTFNPLFPNGYYFTLASYTGYTNLVHVKSSLTLHPTNSAKLLLALGSQWRETTGDAVYTMPNIPVAGTAGKPGMYTGTYGQVRFDWAVTRYASFAVEAVHFHVADVIRGVGEHDSDYLGVQVSVGW